MSAPTVAERFTKNGPGLECGFPAPWPAVGGMMTAAGQVDGLYPCHPAVVMDLGGGRWSAVVDTAASPVVTVHDILRAGVDLWLSLPAVFAGLARVIA